MNNLPSIVVVSSSNTKPKSIIKLITKENPEEYETGVIIQPWRIDTKYYSATVNIIGVHEKYDRDEKFNGQVEALIIHMDANRDSGLEDLKQWDCLERDCEPEVKLLVSNYCNKETKVTIKDAVRWCSKRGFEFIELYPSSTQNKEEEIIPEKFGVSRIIEALQAHTWSNLTMKKKKSIKATKTTDSSITKDSNSPQIQKCSEPASVKEFKDEFAAEDDFTELFSQLHMMKDSLQSLPMSQRKQCAEQMVTAFWKAIGGEEEELVDL